MVMVMIIGVGDGVDNGVGVGDGVDNGDGDGNGDDNWCW